MAVWGAAGAEGGRIENEADGIGTGRYGCVNVLFAGQATDFDPSFHECFIPTVNRKKRPKMKSII